MVPPLLKKSAKKNVVTGHAEIEIKNGEISKHLEHFKLTETD
jgi:hypothetical protein